MTHGRLLENTTRTAAPMFSGVYRSPGSFFGLVLHLWCALRVSGVDFELAAGFAMILRTSPALRARVREAITTLASPVTAGRDSATDE